jgi:hypothetical protein
VPTTLGTASLSGGVAQLVLPSGLAAGIHDITASYSGDGNFVASSDGLAFQHTLVQVARDTTTQITLIGAPNPAAALTVTFTATVVPASNPGGTGAIGGTVTFKEGTTVLASKSTSASGDGQATFTISSLAVGAHTITAIYQSNDLFGELPTPASTSVIEVILPPLATQPAPHATTGTASAVIVERGMRPGQSTLLAAFRVDHFFALAGRTRGPCRTLAGALKKPTCAQGWFE